MIHFYFARLKKKQQSIGPVYVSRSLGLHLPNQYRYAKSPEPVSKSSSSVKKHVTHFLWVDIHYCHCCVVYVLVACSSQVEILLQCLLRTPSTSTNRADSCRVGFSNKSCARLCMMSVRRPCGVRFY